MIKQVGSLEKEPECHIQCHSIVARSVITRRLMNIYLTDIAAGTGLGIIMRDVTKSKIEPEPIPCWQYRWYHGHMFCIFWSTSSGLPKVDCTIF